MSSVLDYGAVGNGTNDDTTAFQNAVNAAPVGGFVDVPTPPVNYKLTAAVTIGGSLTLRGLGTAPLIKQVTADTAGFYV